VGMLSLGNSSIMKSGPKHFSVIAFCWDRSPDSKKNPITVGIGPFL
jgi:hypothetical protein